MRRIIFIFLVFIFSSCDFWYDDICKSACQCRIDIEFGSFFCNNNRKEMCNWNSKLIYSSIFNDLGYNCEERDLVCNTFNDGYKCSEDDYVIQKMVEEIYGVYLPLEILRTTLYYKSFRCCL